MWYEGKLSNLKNGLERQNTIGILTDDINFFIWIDENLKISHFEHRSGRVFLTEVALDGSRILVLRWGQELFSLGRIVPCEAGVSRNVFADFNPDNYVMLCRDGVKRVVEKVDGELYMRGGQDEELLKFEDYNGIVRMARKRWVTCLNGRVVF